MEDKSLFVYDYVNLKNRQLVRKNGKKRYLGDVDGRYRYHAPQQTQSLMGSLIKLDFPETRAINTKSADAIIADQSKQIRSTYQKTFRNATLEAWSRPDSSLDDRPYSSLESRPQTAPESTFDLQPQINNRPHTTGNRMYRTPSRKPPRASGFMVVKVKPDGSMKDVGIRTVTEEIRDWWQQDDKRQRERARKAHSQNLKRYDSFAGQWLSFAGDQGEKEAEGGVIDAFTGHVPRDEFYNIESRVGASVAMQLRNGNRVRVGVNGILQSDSLKVKKWKNDPEDPPKKDSIEDIFREARAKAPAVVPLEKETEGKVRQKQAEDLIPLSWTEQIDKPNVKVLGLREPCSPPPKLDLSERHPVVFHPLVRDGSRPQSSVKLGRYRINQQSRRKIGIDGAESLNNRITRVTVDQINRAEGNSRELTDEDYENLLQERIKSVNVEEEDEEEDGENEDDDLLDEVITEGREGYTHPSPRRKLEDMQENSMYSIGRESERSGLTVEKPPTMRSLQASMHDFAIHGSPPEKSRPHVRQVASAIPSTRHAQSMDPALSAPPRTMARSAGSQRIQPRENDLKRLGAQSASSRRALSSASSRKRYSFDQPVTPHNAHSPRPNLIKPGHLPRSKVSSISQGPQEGDQEYIKFSQQILRPGDARSRESSAGLMAMGESNQPRHGSGDMRYRPEPSIISTDDVVSVDSMNVHRGDPHQKPDHYHEDGTKCTCSEEAKRAMSAALSAMSHVSTDHSVINIPTAPMTPSESDRNSLSDMDPLSSTSSFRRTSFDEDDWKDTSGNDSKPETSASGHRTAAEQVTESGDHSNITDIGSPTPSREIIINKDDGLDAQGITPPRSAGKKRTVKFSDEIPEPFVPYTSPSSTPRDPAHPGSREGSVNSGDFAPEEKRPDLTATEPSSRAGSASQELMELRSKIKADLQQSQAETQQDLEELKSQGPSG
ncbi:uncharacterized protein [Diadema antillarum]|uniref:uncharacterized protein n=1 Tax=Diadema antillarum TaxID=105358 RepID=UPI003A8C809E